MGTRNVRRAMRDEQKEERRQAILDTTWTLFQTTTYEALTIVDVANALGLAKGTIFLYFKTKEGLFLALVEQQLEIWFARVDARLIELRSGCTISQIVQLFAEELEAQPALVRLLAILHTLLEQNIDLPTAVQFKHMLRGHFEETGVLLEQCLPFLKIGQGAHLLLQCHALVIGLWHLSDPAPVVQQALQEPQLEVFKLHFTQEFILAVQALLYGLEHIKQNLQEYDIG